MVWLDLSLAISNIKPWGRALKMIEDTEFGLKNSGDPKSTRDMDAIRITGERVLDVG